MMGDTIISTIYKRGTKGEIRTWSVEVEGSRYRVTTGIKDGVKIIHETPRL